METVFISPNMEIIESWFIIPFLLLTVKLLTLLLASQTLQVYFPGTSANRFLKGTSGGVRGSPTVFNGFLLTPDYYNQRLLAFDINLLTNGMNASYVF